jgi:hypothetical protein
MPLLLAGIFAGDFDPLAECSLAKIKTPLRWRGIPCPSYGAAAVATAVIASTVAEARPRTTAVSRAL